MKPFVNHRFKQAEFEAKCAVFLTLCYMLLWFLTAYCVPAKQMLFGIPLWFILSCIINPLLFIGLCCYIVKRCFKQMDLGDEQ